MCFGCALGMRCICCILAIRRCLRSHDMTEKKKTKAKKKNSQLVIRINDEQRDEFVSLCEELDTSAAREIRRFIRGFLAEHDQEEG